MKRGGLLLATGALALFLLAPKKKSSKKKSEETAEVSKEEDDGEYVKTQPPKTQPAKTEPAETEPAKTEPAKTEPAKTEPAKPSAPKSESLSVNEDCSEIFIDGTRISTLADRYSETQQPNPETDKFLDEHLALIDSYVKEFNPEEQNFFDLTEDIVEAIAPQCLIEMNPESISKLEESPEKNKDKILFNSFIAGGVLARFVGLGVFDTVEEVTQELLQSAQERGISGLGELVPPQSNIDSATLGTPLDDEEALPLLQDSLGDDAVFGYLEFSRRA